MTIVTLGSNYYIPVNNGFKQIIYAEAMDLYEQGEITHEETLDMEYD